MLVIAVITFSVAVWFIRMWLMAKKEKGNHNHEKNRHLLFPKQKMSYLVFAALVFLISGSFYWFEVRQVRIKHDCSWVKRHSNAVPSRPVMTAEELKSKGIIDSCEDGFKFYGQFADYNEAVIEQCEAKNKRLVEEYKQPKRAEPEKDWQVKATKEEYEFCLHDRGL